MLRKKTNRVIFHHALAEKANVALITEWHKARGFDSCGYHFVLLKDGTIEHGRDFREVGAHALGKNHDSIGVCFEGNFFKEKPTEEQIFSASKVYHNICRAYQKLLSIEFHRPEGLENSCPGSGLDRKEFVQTLSKAVTI